MASLLSQRAPVNIRGDSDIALLHRMECRACPLDKVPQGKLEPTGSTQPLVYILGEAAGATEAKAREQFVGDSGQLLRAHIPRRYKERLRFNNCARSHPPKNATPDKVILECCRPSVVRDIEATKPKAIFGFGNIPLEWVSSFSGITLWRGRRMPVRVGNHTCWFYPMLHPSYLLRQRRRDKPSDEEHMFGLDMQRAFSEVETLPKAVVHTRVEALANVEVITGEKGDIDLDRVRKALSWAAKQRVIGLDYETNGLRPYFEGAKVLAGAVATGERAVAIAFDHPEAGWSPSERAVLQELWREFLLTAEGIKAVHNLAFEMEWTAAEFGSDMLRAGRWGDTMTQAGVIDERKGGKQRSGPFSLEFLVQQYFGFNLKKLSGVDRSALESTPVEVVLNYNAPDARYHALLFEKQEEIIEERGLELAYELGLRSVPAVVMMQAKGLPVDQKEVKRLDAKYEKEFKATVAKLRSLDVVKQCESMRGATFNPLSNPEVLFVLKDIMKRREVLVEDKYTKKRKYSADEPVLKKIDHPFAKLLIALRKINKNWHTYVTPLKADSEESSLYSDGLLHAQFNTVFAETGRLSCEEPNLQNFPKRDNNAKEVRKQVVAPPGCVMLAFDMGQIEARVIAMFTKDKQFCKALWERYDIHMEWAERLARAYPARIGGKKNLTDKGAMKAFRTDVKNQWTFPLFFGAKLESAAGYLNMPADVIKPHYNEFWRQFSGVKAWQEQQLDFYKEHGYVECLTGKRRHGPLSVNKIYNSPVQGTAAALVIEALSRLSETGDPELQPEIQIHDDLTWARVPEKRVDEIAEKILDIMLKPVFPWINVPLTVEGAVGPNWLEMQEFGTFSSDTWFS